MGLRLYGLGLTALIGAGLAVLPFYTFNWRVGWLLSVLITEYGHWLAVAALALAIAAWPVARGLTLVFVVAAVVYAKPAAQLFWNAGAWRAQMQSTFDAVTAERPSLARLFLGRLWFTPIPPRVIGFAPDLTLNYYPAVATTSPAPFVVVIHGGGWDSGDADQMPELNSYLAQRGFAVAAVNYRLAPQYHWPAARDDVRAAVAYLKAHAAELGLDPTRWVIFGRSAGGQLAQVVAYGADDPSLKGCVALYAPTDMHNAYEWGLENDILGSRPLVRAYMDGAPGDRVAAYDEASALKLIGEHAPPTLLLHGGRDPLVWVHHAELLRSALGDRGVRAALIEVPWGTHGFDYNSFGPGGQALTLALDGFLSRTLRVE